MAAYFYNTLKLSDSGRSQPLNVPMVYEQITAEPATWEYHVLSVDLREQPVPDIEMLNKLGKEGWLLVSILSADERRQATYYFVRQHIQEL